MCFFQQYFWHYFSWVVVAIKPFHTMAMASMIMMFCSRLDKLLLLPITISNKTTALFTKIILLTKLHKGFKTIIFSQTLNNIKMLLHNKVVLVITTHMAHGVIK
ncbi:MAG: hypothetical protein CMC24_02450 [Flavobacteriaceae bacterium]|nr:hypothetical protein [Flavobacteriaceae bacterium]